MNSTRPELLAMRCSFIFFAFCLAIILCPQITAADKEIDKASDEVLSASGKEIRPAKAKAKTCKTFNKFRGQVMNGDMIVHLRDQVIGLSPPDIEKLLGSPDFREGSSLSIGGKSGQDNWLYIVGSKPTLFRIMFKLGHCNETSALDYDEDPTYAEWYNDRMGRQLEHFAVGKTVPQLAEDYGLPSQKYDKSDSYLKIMAQEIDTSHAAFWSSADEMLIYRFDQAWASGYATTVHLAIRNGRCNHVFVDKSFIAGFNWRTARREPGPKFVSP